MASPLFMVDKFSSNVCAASSEDQRNADSNNATYLHVNNEPSGKNRCAVLHYFIYLHVVTAIFSKTVLKTLLNSKLKVTDYSTKKSITCNGCKMCSI